MRRPESIREKSVIHVLTVTATMFAVMGFVSSPAIAQKGGKRGGGGGGGNTGAETVVNPAFVFKKNSAYHLLTHDGSQQMQLTSPSSQAADSAADWSPDGMRVAFFRQPDSSRTPRDLYVVDLYEDANGVDPARSSERLVVPLATNITIGAPRLSWGPTGEIVFHDDHVLYGVDPDDGEPNKRVLADFSGENNDLPLPGGFAAGPSIDLTYIHSVDVQPVIIGNTVTIALGAQWRVNGVTGYSGSDILLVDADVSSGSLVIDHATFRNLTNPMYEDGLYLPEHIDWSQDGLELTFQEWYYINDDDADEEQYITSYNFVTDQFTVLVTGDPNDDSAAPNLPHSLSPDGLELALGVGTPAKGGTTYDVFRVPANEMAYSIRGPESVNVTNTLRASARELDPVWRPTWIRQ